MNVSSQLGEKTVIPIGWFFAALSVAGLCLSTVVGVALYISKIESKADSSLTANDLNKAQIKEMNISVSEFVKEIYSQNIEIDRRLSRIEGKLGVSTKQ